MPYYTFNVALHGVNAALLFLLLRRLGIGGAWVAAAIWAVHPVTVESVAWIAELKNLQSSFFDIYFFLCSYVADHFQYLACVGVIALVVTAGIMTLKRGTAQIVAAGVIVVVIGASSFQRTGVFQNDETLWRDTIAKNPEAFVAYNNLGMILMKRGDYQQAEMRFRETLRLKPNYVKARANLGSVLSKLGRHDEALEESAEAVRLERSLLTRTTTLCVALVIDGSMDEASAEFLTALRLRPDFEEATRNLQAALRRESNASNGPMIQVESE